MRLLPALGLLGLATLAPTGCKSIVKGVTPSVQRSDLRVDGIDFEGIDLVVDLDVHNPLGVSLHVPSYRFALELEGNPFASGDASGGFDLAGGDVTPVSVPLRVGFRELFETVQALEDRSEARYAVEGALQVPVFGERTDVPFSLEGTFPVLRPPVVSGFEVGEITTSMGGISLEVEADLTNPNAFELGVADLGYTLQAGGHDVGTLKASTGATVPARETRRLVLSGGMSSPSGLWKGSHALRLTGTIETPFGDVRLR